MNKVKLTEYHIKNSKRLECPLKIFICRKQRFGGQKYNKKNFFFYNFSNNFNKFIQYIKKRIHFNRKYGK
jgi:hypothetical protein